MRAPLEQRPLAPAHPPCRGTASWGQSKRPGGASLLPPAAQRLCKSKAGHSTAAGADCHLYSASSLLTSKGAASLLTLGKRVQDLVREARSMQVSCLQASCALVIRSGGVSLQQLATACLP